MDENEKGNGHKYVLRNMQKDLQQNMHTQESTVHESSATCIAAKHTSVTNKTPEETQKRNYLFPFKTMKKNLYKIYHEETIFYLETKRQDYQEGVFYSSFQTQRWEGVAIKKKNTVQLA